MKEYAHARLCLARSNTCGCRDRHFAGLRPRSAPPRPRRARETTFSMFPQTSLLNCVKPSPDARTPRSTVNVKRGDLNDRATVELEGLQAEPRLRPVHDPAQPADRQRARADPNPSVGLAWYQSDLHVGADGAGQATDPDDPARPDLRCRQGRRRSRRRTRSTSASGSTTRPTRSAAASPVRRRSTVSTRPARWRS